MKTILRIKNKMAKAKNIGVGIPVIIVLLGISAYAMYAVYEQTLNVSISGTPWNPTITTSPSGLGIGAMGLIGAVVLTLSGLLIWTMF